jgi:glycine/D-amino acid oxidase-like deaminating enzyme
MQREFIRSNMEMGAAAGSPWLMTDASEWPSLELDLEADVVIVGAGVVGALVARELTSRGMSVVVLERRRAAGGTTGHSTAKITALHGFDWGAIEKMRRVDEALYEWASLNAQAPEVMRRIAEEDGIECRFRKLDGYLCERMGATDEILCREWAALSALGIPIEDAESICDSPFGGVVALRLAEQAQFDSAAFTLGVIGALPRSKARVFEGSAVRSLVREGDLWVARTDNGTVRAPNAVMASLATVTDPALLFARLFPYTYYVMETQPVSLRDGMWIEVNGRELTARPTDKPDGPWIFCGPYERVGDHDDVRGLYDELRGDVSAVVPEAVPQALWSGEDFSTPDRLPFVGEVGARSGLYYAGGFGAWGMSKASVAARLIAEEIEGAASPALRKLLSPNRFPPFASLPVLAKEGGFTAVHLALPSSSQKHASAALGAIAPGDPMPRCTHLHCLTKVNEVEGTIDCPCHGSRFAADGSPVYGPAQRDLSIEE